MIFFCCKSDDKLPPETPEEDLHHVGVPIALPRGLLSNSHASHIPHCHHLQLSHGFQMSYCHQQLITKQPPEQGFLSISRATPAQPPKHHVQPRQHLSTFSPTARRLKSDQICLALPAHGCLVWGLQSHLAFLLFASLFGKISPSLGKWDVECGLAVAAWQVVVGS